MSDAYYLRSGKQMLSEASVAIEAQEKVFIHLENCLSIEAKKIGSYDSAIASILGYLDGEPDIRTFLVAPSAVRCVELRNDLHV